MSNLVFKVAFFSITLVGSCFVDLNTNFREMSNEVIFKKQLVEGGGIDFLIFKNECYTSISYSLKDGWWLYKYFEHPDVLSSSIKSFCKDTSGIGDKNYKIIDYLNGKHTVLEINYKDSNTAKSLFAEFSNDFKANSGDVEKFWFLKPGFILLLERKKIKLILINDCGVGNFSIVRNYVKENFVVSNRLISRCGLNFE